MRHINKKVIFTLKIACSASYVLMIKTILIIIDYRTFFFFRWLRSPAQLPPGVRKILLRLAIDK
ncbi:Ferrous iron transport protein A [Klebsiella pneumoniae IS46]|uniref:Ferrous iron transport protein A n=1 Tax=Klebsiella pneumoniae IS43 TaxID=1432552 RepID=W1DEJ2_KLEPN|nr:Ferrous iron transport protein A [Klebsiella pneumoniae IS43]CDL18241.1 Ferrous iron transport protein A [Klebsiella pneumoniae IS46]CDL22242.1 Ferrous iron transport protein A [Klebsiella pneumoniae IS53]